MVLFLAHSFCVRVSVKGKHKIGATFFKIRVNIKDFREHLSSIKEVLEKFSIDRSCGTRVIRCATVEGLLLLKCYALPSLYRQGQFSRASIYENDILLLLLNYSVDIENLLKILSNHLLPSDIQEVKTILGEIKGRIQRFSKQQQSLTDE